MPRGNGAGPTRQGRGGGRGFRRAAGKGRGRMGGSFAAGPGGSCVCPKCGYKEPHIVGQPCNAKMCPKCGGQMTRE